MFVISTFVGQSIQCIESECALLQFLGNTNAGSLFYLGFFNHHFSQYCNNMKNPPTVWVTTTEQQPVRFTVETYNKVIFRGTASPCTYTYINIPLELVVSESAPAAVVDRFKGIMIKAEDNKKIVVFAQYEESRSKGAYLALPVMSLSSSTIYKYI